MFLGSQFPGDCSRRKPHSQTPRITDHRMKAGLSYWILQWFSAATDKTVNKKLVTCRRVLWLGSLLGGAINVFCFVFVERDQWIRTSRRQSWTGATWKEMQIQCGHLYFWLIRWGRIGGKEGIGTFFLRTCYWEDIIVVREWRSGRKRLRQETPTKRTLGLDLRYWWDLKMKIVTRKTQFHLSDKRGWRRVGKWELSSWENDIEDAEGKEITGLRDTDGPVVRQRA